MLKKADKLKLKALGFDPDKLVTAITAEDEQDITIPEINNLTEEELTVRDANTIKAARKSIFDEGKTAGIEQTNKAFAKKFNIDEAVNKDFDKIVEGIQTNLTKDGELTKQINLLQSDKTRLENELQAEKTNTSKAKQDMDLISYFPANRTGLTDKEFLMLTKGSLSIEEVDGVTVVKKDGNVLRDTKTQAPIPVKDAVTALFTERKWVGKAEGGGGRGGNDNPGGSGAGIKKFSEAEAQFLKDNPGANVISPQFETYVQGLAKAGDFDFDN